MKIRTRLLLFLLPTLVAGVILAAFFLAYHWHGVRQDLAAGLSLEIIDLKFGRNLALTTTALGAAIVLSVVTLLITANNIAKPIQKLNNSALAIAAGEYGGSIVIDGPKEIADLANTLNTMSECLLENINRLKENSLLRERMYGEYECALLLQHMMLQKNIDECNSDAIAVKSLTLFSDNPRGLWLDLPKLAKTDPLTIQMAEAEETGFEGIYQLLTRSKFAKDSHADLTTLTFDRKTSLLSCTGPHMPIFWSLEHKKFMSGQSGLVKLESGDLFFLYNQGLLNFLKGPKAIQDIIAKVLKVFAESGLETTVAMLQKEIAFATKRKEILEDLHLLCFQVLSL